LPKAYKAPFEGFSNKVCVDIFLRKSSHNNHADEMFSDNLKPHHTATVKTTPTETYSVLLGLAI